jgi:membrane-associated phospholipid phosphatase
VNTIRYRDETIGDREHQTSAPIYLFSSAVLLASAIAAIFFPDRFDYPIIMGVNSFARRSFLFDAAAYAATKYNFFSGAIFLSFIWYCWFLRSDAPARLNVLFGALGAACAAMVSRVMQLTLPTHLRPFYDPAVHFRPTLTIHVIPTHHVHSFTSDHAALYFGLAAAIYSVSRRLGVTAFVLSIILNAARMYLGFHYLSDIIGGAALGILFVRIFQNWHFGRFGGRILDAERYAPALFYMAAFFVSYGIATLFDDVRDLATKMHEVIR